MKKLRIAVLLIILAFSFSVKAETSLGIGCNNNYTIQNDKSVTCEVNLLYEQESINDIEFDYQTNLNIDFIKIDNFIINKSNNKISIHTDKALYDVILNSTKIMEFTVSSNSNTSELENLVISNIRINKSDSIIVNNITKTFKISKNDKLDKVCTLESISVDDKLIDNFDKDQLEYHLNVEKEIIFINAERTSSKSFAVGLGNARVKKGETLEKHITVTAENGDSKIYKLFITNTTFKENNSLKNEEEITKSNDNTLKTLDISTDSIKLSLNPKNEVFNIDVEDNSFITVKAVLNDNKASFTTGYSPREVKLNYGYNQILIKVLAENNEEKVYTINIDNKKKLSDNNELLSLKINDQIINLSDEVMSISLPYEIDKTNIEAVAKDDKSKIIYSDSELLVGDNKITIEVISSSGLSKIYEVNVIRENEEVIVPDVEILDNPIIQEENNSSINIICYLVFGIGMVVLILSIIYINKKKKSTI